MGVTTNLTLSAESLAFSDGSVKGRPNRDLNWMPPLFQISEKARAIGIVAFVMECPCSDAKRMVEIYLTKNGISAHTFIKDFKAGIIKPQQLGDTPPKCKYKSNNFFVHCAVHPTGRCEGCLDFEP